MRKFQIPAGIPVNSFIRFRPEPESCMKIPVPDKPEPDSYLKFPVPVMQNGMKIRKIRYPVPVSKSTFRSSPSQGLSLTICNAKTPAISKMDYRHHCTLSVQYLVAPLYTFCTVCMSTIEASRSFWKPLEDPAEPTNWICLGKIHKVQCHIYSTLAVPGALSHHLQRQNACNIQNGL